MRLEQILFSQGFGSRHECAGMILRGDVRLGGQVADDPYQEVEDLHDGFEFEVGGQVWPYYAHAILAMNKPAGYECSMKPSSHPSVMTLLPAPLRARGVQPVGRLDEDTVGLLILTDDGQLNHRLTHPRRHVPKVYRVTACHDITPGMLERLSTGVVLDDDPRPVAAAWCRPVAARVFDMEISQGRYHQVKRMVAAAGNRVESLCRISVGSYAQPEGLLPGHWCWIQSASQILGGH